VQTGINVRLVIVPVPDGKAMLHTSDLIAYSNMYLVEVGAFEELPDLA
jgi:hypothetical protein